MKVLVLLFLIPLNLFAESGIYKGIAYTVEPIYGKETVNIDKEARIVQTEYFYGARITAAWEFLNLEGVYTKTNRGQFLASDIKNSAGYEIERLKVGIYGSYELLPILLGIVRAGGDAKKVTTVSVTNGNISRIEGDTLYRPYLGLGIEAGPKLFSLTAGVTIVFHAIPDDYFDNDYQYSLGFKLRI
jgi:hypothetical protein